MNGVKMATSSGFFRYGDRVDDDDNVEYEVHIPLMQRAC